MSKKAIRKTFVVLFGLFLAISGCSKSGKDEEKAPVPGTRIENPEPQKEKTGSIVGKIVYNGTPLTVKKIKTNKDNEVCGEHQYSEELVVNLENKGIKWATVSLKSDIGNMPARQEKTLDQKACRFEPHVLAIEAGGTVNIFNSDGVLHNIHTFSANNKPFNEAQPKFKKKIAKVFGNAPEQIKIKCDVHSWMNGWIIVIKNPYYDVTDANGEFRIENVPVGRHTLEVWHETLGTAELEVEVEESKETRVETFAWGLMSILPVPDKGANKGTTVAKPIFDANCAACHGVSGKGDGPAAASLPNKPANLISDAIQKKSDSELESTIRDGRQEKGMPPWKTLSPKDIKNLVDYIRYLGGK